MPGAAFMLSTSLGRVGFGLRADAQAVGLQSLVDQAAMLGTLAVIAQLVALVRQAHYGSSQAFSGGFWGLKSSLCVQIGFHRSPHCPQYIEH